MKYYTVNVNFKTVKLEKLMFLFSHSVHKISGALFSNIMQEIPYYYYIKT